MRTLLGCTLVLVLAWAGSVQAQERGFGVSDREDANKVALVIGNGDYDAAPLRNPPNDARDMAAALRDLGFRVIHQQDADQVEMKRAVREFGEAIRRADVALFYYAGHGIQAQGRNYLIPVGAVINSEPEVEYEAVDAGFVIAQMEAAGSPLNIVILDACRNNPFARSFRSASRGLTQVTAPTGTLIAYATAPGSVASDGDGDNGLYTQELLRYMRTPGLSVEEVFKQVRISLNQQTNGDQTPWESSSLVGNFYFAAPPEEAPAVAAQPAQESPTEPTARPPTERPEVARPEDRGPPPPPSEAEVREHLAACMDPLVTGDVNVFDRRYSPGERENAREVVRDWLRSATGRNVERGAARPGIDVVGSEGRTAVAGGSARFSWRSGFGVNRSTEVAVESVVAFENGRWVLETCRIAGSVDDLR